MIKYKKDKIEVIYKEYGRSSINVIDKNYIIWESDRVRGSNKFYQVLSETPRLSGDFLKARVLCAKKIKRTSKNLNYEFTDYLKLHDNYMSFSLHNGENRVRIVITEQSDIFFDDLKPEVLEYMSRDGVYDIRRKLFAWASQYKINYIETYNKLSSKEQLGFTIHFSDHLITNWFKFFQIDKKHLEIMQENSYYYIYERSLFLLKRIKPQFNWDNLSESEFKVFMHCLPGWINLNDDDVINIYKHYQYYKNILIYRHIVTDQYSMYNKIKKLGIEPPFSKWIDIDKLSEYEIYKIHSKASNTYNKIHERIKEELFHQNIDVEYKNGTYSILIPQNSCEVIDEGNNLHHCVGSYIDSIIDGKCNIVFLRKNDDLTKSFFTIELNKHDNEFIIRQCHGKYNSNPDNEVIEFLKEWADNKPINKNSIHEIYEALNHL